jgi:anaerobic C4-dicarboxylate transporter
VIGDYLYNKLEKKKKQENKLDKQDNDDDKAKEKNGFELNFFFFFFSNLFYVLYMGMYIVTVVDRHRQRPRHNIVLTTCMVLVLACFGVAWLGLAWPGLALHIQLVLLVYNMITANGRRVMSYG